MTTEELDQALTTLKDLVNRAGLSALTGSCEAQAAIARLEAAGYRIQFKVGVAAERNHQRDADLLASERRLCPYCSTESAPMPMRGHVVKERVAGQGERDVIEGLQVRFTCSACGCGEVVPVPAA